MSNRTHVIKFGNHWLQSDDRCEHSRWVRDLSDATHHTKEWAETLAEENKNEKRFESMSLQDAVERGNKAANEAVKTRWLYDFEEKVRERYGDRISTNGLWSNAHMYHAMGITVAEAVEAIGKSFRLNLA